MTGGGRKLLSNRLVKLATAVAAAFALLLGSAGTANAAIYWTSIYLVNQQSQACLAGSPHIQYPGLADAEMAQGCMFNGTDQIYLSSIRSDLDGHARVFIGTPNPDGLMICLTPGVATPSVSLHWEYCDSTKDSQVWTMSTAAVPQNVGNPLGLKHFINFYNKTTNTCLDGGRGPYGLPNGCSTTNNWQIWNIYTNLGSEPYRG